MNAGAIGGMAGGLAVTVVFGLLRRYRPYREPEPLDPPLSDDERGSYQRWEASALIPYFVFTAALTYLWFLVGRATADLVDPTTPTTRFLIRPNAIFWLLPAIFLGFITSALPLVILYRTLLGERYERYNRACCERHGFDGWPLFRGLAFVIVPVAIAAMGLGARTYVRFDDGGIELVRPFGAGVERHDYGQVAALEHRWSFVAPNGNTVHRPYHVIRFADGTSWDTRHQLGDPVPARDARIIAFVADRSGRPITEIP